MQATIQSTRHFFFEVIAEEEYEARWPEQGKRIRTVCLAPTACGYGLIHVEAETPEQAEALARESQTFHLCRGNAGGRVQNLRPEPHHHCVCGVCGPAGYYSAPEGPAHKPYCPKYREESGR